MNYGLKVLKNLFVIVMMIPPWAQAQNTTAPEMPIPPEFQTNQQNQPMPQPTPPNQMNQPARPFPPPTPAAQPSKQATTQTPPQPNSMNQVPPSRPMPQPQTFPPNGADSGAGSQMGFAVPPRPGGAGAATPTSPPPTMTPAEMPPVPVDSKMPEGFELIGIKPYFKNKARMGHLVATLHSQTNQVVATVSGDFGDCKSCLRGASIKGKLGIRLYGNELTKLTVSRKQSASIRLVTCNANNDMPFVGGRFDCDFLYRGSKMKLMLNLGP